MGGAKVHHSTQTRSEANHAAEAMARRGRSMILVADEYA